MFLCRYLSFVLMLSLAIADVLHGIVTTTFFYPPIVMKMLITSPTGTRIYNILDWTAWSITLTFALMIKFDSKYVLLGICQVVLPFDNSQNCFLPLAICLDRLIAIMLYCMNISFKYDSYYSFKKHYHIK